MGLSPDCLNFDIGNACLGFLDGMTVAANLISGQIDYALVVDGENSREVVTHTLERLSQFDVTADIFQENFATLTLGSGQQRWCWLDENWPRSSRYTEIHYMAATEHNQPAGANEGMTTDAKGLLIAGLQTAMVMTNKVMNDLNWKERKVDEIVIHQVSARNTQLLAEALNLDEEKMLLTFQISVWALRCLPGNSRAGTHLQRRPRSRHGDGWHQSYMEILVASPAPRLRAQLDAIGQYLIDIYPFQVDSWR